MFIVLSANIESVFLLKLFSALAPFNLENLCMRKKSIYILSLNRWFLNVCTQVCKFVIRGFYSCMMTISLKPKKLKIEKYENYISGETEVEDEFSNHTKTLWLDMSWIHRFFSVGN